MHSNSDCTAFSIDANKIACECGCEFPRRNAVAKPRRAMSVAQNMHAFLAAEVF